MRAALEGARGEKDAAGAGGRIDGAILAVARRRSLVMSSLVALIREEGRAVSVFGPIRWDEAADACRRSHPRLVLIEYAAQRDSSGGQIGELIGRLRVAAPLMDAVLFVTDERDVDAATVDAAQAGAAGVIGPDDSVEGFLRMLGDAAHGHRLLATDELASLAERVESQRQRIRLLRLRMGTLTRRESEVLGRLGEGLRNDAIAIDLGISLRTVEKHVEHVLQKLGAISRAQAVRMALDLRRTT